MSDKNPTPWQARRIDAAAIAALLVLTLAAYLLAVRPAMQREESRIQLVHDLADEQKKLAQDQTELIALQQRTAKLSTVRGNVPQLEPLENLNQRLARLTDIAAANHLRIDGMEPGKPKPGPQCRMVEIRLAGRGTFGDCAAFLADVHNQLPDTSMDALELTGQPGSNDPSAGFTFRLVWYTQPAVAR